MSQPHDFAFTCLCGYFEGVWQRLSFDDQGMVARRLKRLRHLMENCLPIVMDRRGLAMHESLCADDFSTEYLGERLMPEANAQDWNLQAPL